MDIKFMWHFHNCPSSLITQTNKYYLNPLGPDRVRNVGLSLSVFYSHSSLLKLFHQTLHCELVEGIARHRIQ